MLLYIVYDKTQRTLTTPLLAPSLEIAQNSLQELNPENLNDLILHPLATLNSVLDIFLITLDENKELPSFLTNTSDDYIVEDTNEVRESSDLHNL